MKKMIQFALQMLGMFVAVVMGGVAMAAAPAATALEGAGKTVNNEGGQTRSNVEPNGDPEFYAKDVDQEIAKIRPQSTVIDTMTRQIAKRRVRPEGREPLPDKAGESTLLSRSGG